MSTSLNISFLKYEWRGWVTYLHNLHNSHLILVIELMTPGMSKLLGVFSLVHRVRPSELFRSYQCIEAPLWVFKSKNLREHNLIVVIHIICFKYDDSWYGWSIESFFSLYCSHLTPAGKINGNVVSQKYFNIKFSLSSGTKQYYGIASIILLEPTFKEQ